MRSTNNAGATTMQTAKWRRGCDYARHEQECDQRRSSAAIAELLISSSGAHWRSVRPTQTTIAASHFATSGQIGVSMAQHAHNPRPWKTIACELSQEHDPEKIIALSIELNRVLEEQDQSRNPQSNGDRP